MPNNSERENSESFLSHLFKSEDKLFLIIILTLIIMVLLILYLIEKIIFIILTFITFTPIIAFPLQVVLHMLLIRYIILEIAFSGQNLFISRSIFYNYGRAYAKHIYNALVSLRESLSVFNDIRSLAINLKELNSVKTQINSINVLINQCLYVLDKIRNKFHQLTIDQQVFFNSLNLLKYNINNGNFIKFIDETIQTIEKNGKNSLADLPEEDRDSIVSKISHQDSNNLNIQKISTLLGVLIEQINDYLGEHYSCFSKRFIRNYLKNKLFASIEQFQIELIDQFCIEEYQLITKDKCQIEYILIKSNPQTHSKKLMIICGPNGVPYQIFVRNLRFTSYLQSNIDILCWNYRGYGFSKGKPSYNKLRSDVLELFDEVKKNFNYERYGVHGISIGGIPCCHLARNRKEIELMICDRNFGRLDNIAQGFYCGKFLFFIYKYFFFQSSDNVDNYINVKCDKILLNDSKDQIVLEICSLKTLVARRLCELYFDCNNNNNNNVDNDVNDANLNDSNHNTLIKNFSSNNNELEILRSKKINISAQNNELNSSEQLSSNNRYNNPTNKKIILPKKTALDKILNSVEEKNIFIHSLINISNIINKDKLEVNPKKSFLYKIINLVKKNSVQYLNLREEEMQNTSGIFDFVKEHMFEILDSVQSAGDTLLTLNSLKTDYLKYIFIDNFFNNMFIWGSFLYNSNNENIQIHKLKNVKTIFNDTMKLFEEFINSLENMNYKQLTLVKEINTIYKYFSQISQNLENIGLKTKNGFIKLIDDDLIEDKDDNISYEKCLLELNRGNYVPLYCGHNGALSKEEKETLDYYLMKTSFMNNGIENLNIENISTNEENDLIKMNSPDSSKNININ